MSQDICPPPTEYLPSLALIFTYPYNKSLSPVGGETICRIRFDHADQWVRLAARGVSR